MPEITEVIAKALREGLVHPGDPDRGVKPKPIITPFSRPTAGMPKEMANLMDGTVKLLSEAIVAKIEETHELVPRDEARVMRHATAGGKLEPNFSTPVFCRKCKSGEPLMMLSITDPERIVVDGPALIKGLSNRSVGCPHKQEG